MDTFPAGENSINKTVDPGSYRDTFLGTTELPEPRQFYRHCSCKTLDLGSATDTFWLSWKSVHRISGVIWESHRTTDLVSSMD